MGQGAGKEDPGAPPKRTSVTRLTRRSRPPPSAPQMDTVRVWLMRRLYELRVRPEDTVEDFVATLCEKANQPFHRESACLLETRSGVQIDASGSRGKQSIRSWLDWKYWNPAVASSSSGLYAFRRYSS